MNRILVVIDMQNDFIDGALGTKEAKKTVPAVVEKIKSFEGQIIFTQDTHTDDYGSTQEGRRLPVPHCIKGTPGFELNERVGALAREKGCLIFSKPAFGSRDLADYLYTENLKNRISQIELIGLCTDICVISNALLLKAFLTETEIVVDSTCCAGVTVKSHGNALEAMKMCQITVI